MYFIKKFSLLSYIILLAILTLSGCSGGGESSGDDSGGETGNITPPVTVTASDDQVESITIIWTEVEDALSYNIYRGDSCENAESNQVASVIEETSYEDSVNEGDAYYYKITAVGAIEESDFSECVTGVEYSVSVFPDSPVNIDATDSSTDAVTVTWDAVSGSGIEYSVYRSDSFDGIYDQISGDVTDLFYDDSTAIAGVHYYYKIQAVNIYDNESDLSDYDEGWVEETAVECLTNQEMFDMFNPMLNDSIIARLDATPFNYPSTVTVDGDTSGQFVATREIIPPFLVTTMEFTDYVDTSIDGNSYVMNGTMLFQLDFMMDGTLTGTLNVTGDQTGSVIFNIVIKKSPMTSRPAPYDGTYSIQICDNISDDFGVPVLDPVEPESIMATDSEDDMVLLSWSLVLDFDITYNIYRSEAVVGAYTLIASGLTSTYYEDTTMLLEQSYFYKVSAVNRIGAESPLSTEDEGWANTSILTIDEFTMEIYMPVVMSSLGYKFFPRVDNQPIPPINEWFYGNTSGHGSAADIPDTSPDYYPNENTMHWVGDWNNPPPLATINSYTYVNFNDGEVLDVDGLAIPNNEGGMILNGTLTMDLNGSFIGIQTGTHYCSGSHVATVVHHLIINGQSDPMTGYLTVTYNGETQDLYLEDYSDNDDDGYTLLDGDCDILDGSIYPGAPEICGDGIDQNCDEADLPCN